jgi:4-hydroxymandelate oxidase
MRWIDSLQAEAEARLLPEVADYYRQGAGAGISLAESVAAWDAVRLRPHVLRDVSTVTSATTVLGAQLSTPVLVASSTLQMQADPLGEAAMAAGVGAAGSLLTVSSNTGIPFADIGAAGAPWWVQAYVLEDRGRTRAMLERAVAAGAGAAVVTVDTPIVGTRHFVGRRVWDVVPEVHLMGNWDLTDTTQVVNEKARDLTTADIAWLAEVTGIPVVVKGILRGDDARQAVDAGAAAVVVSNHGGRQLDQAVSTAQALPEVAEALADTSALVTVDGGIRTGIHVLAALAMGADAVWVGRPALWALSVGGAEGVARLVADLTAELVEAMMLCGASRLSDLTPDLLARSTIG